MSTVIPSPSSIPTLLTNLNTSRETTISKHYDASIAELNEKVASEPLRTSFHIKAGCISKEVTEEIAKRFVSGGLSASPCKGGLLSTFHYLNVEVTLPDHLSPKPKIDTKVDPKVDVKVEEKTPFLKSA